MPSKNNITESVIKTLGVILPIAGAIICSTFYFEDRVQKIVRSEMKSYVDLQQEIKKTVDFITPIVYANESKANTLQVRFDNFIKPEEINEIKRK